MSNSHPPLGIFLESAIVITPILQQEQGVHFGQVFSYAYLYEKTLEESLLIAQKLVALKLQHEGGLPNDLDVFPFEFTALEV